MAEITIKLATIGDVPALIELRTAFLAEAMGDNPGAPGLIEALSQYFLGTLPSGEFVAFLALAGDRPIAASGLVFRRLPPISQNLSGMEGYIMNMYTAPEWRGRGIASTLLKELLAVARQANCHRIRLHSFPQAAPVYLRMGFVPVAGEMEWKTEEDGRGGEI